MGAKYYILVKEEGLDTYGQYWIQKRKEIHACTSERWKAAAGFRCNAYCIEPAV